MSSEKHGENNVNQLTVFYIHAADKNEYIFILY